jgi:5-methylcytosine-specific restriction endonuclease McrA
MESVLVLNTDAQPLSVLPLSIVSWQDAIKSVYLGKADIIEHYDDKTINSPNFEIPMPSVIMLRRYHKRPNVARFSRRNLYLRDNFTCQYCNIQYPAEDLTIDHVIPRCKGGDTSWENCTTACFKCNTHKSDKLIKPLKTPVHPTWYQINNSRRFFNLVIPHKAWQSYIEWPPELVIVNEKIVYH